MRPAPRAAARRAGRDARAGAGARSSSASSSARRKAWPSAVPCTSTKPPPPVITTFMSVSARRVLGVVEVEHRHAVDDADRHRGDLAVSGLAPSEPLRDQRVDRHRQRDVGAGDRRGAGAAVGLQHVAVERDRALAERAPGRPRRAASGRSGAGSPACGRLACRAPPRAALRVWVARGSMPYSAVTQPWPLPRRNAAPFLDARGAQHARVAELDQHRAFGVPREPRVNPDGRSSSGARPPDLVAGTDHAPDPAHSRPPRCCRWRRRRLYGALTEARKRILETSRATRPAAPTPRSRRQGALTRSRRSRRTGCLPASARRATERPSPAGGLPAQATLDEVAHRMRRRLVGGDHGLPATAARHGCDRACARRPCRRAAGRCGCRRCAPTMRLPSCTRHTAQVARGRMFERQVPGPSSTTSSCARPMRQMQESERIEQRLRRDCQNSRHQRPCKAISAAARRRRGRPCRRPRPASNASRRPAMATRSWFSSRLPTQARSACSIRIERSGTLLLR